MITYLTSNLKNYYKDNGKKVPKEMNNDNKIIDSLKADLKSYKGLLMIASNPNDYEKMDFYINLMKESLRLSGFKDFDHYYVLDNRFLADAKKYIDNSSLIILSGGHTYTQKLFFDEIKLKELLNGYDGIVLGISAGTVNMADNVYNSPEFLEDKDLPFEYKGLGLTNINVEPHFEESTETFDDNALFQRECVIKESYNRRIIGLCDGSHIRSGVLYGQGYEVINGTITKICDTGNSIML